MESGVGAWYCLFTGVGEWVVGSVNGTKSKKVALVKEMVKDNYVPGISKLG